MKLSAYFLNHRHGRTSHGLHRKGREEERQHASYKKSRHYTRIGDADTAQFFSGVRSIVGRDKGGKKGQSRQSGRADGKAFSDGSCGVAHRIEFIGTLTHFGRQFAHFGNTACIVRNGAVSIHSQLDTRVGKHPDRCNGDAVEATEGICSEDGRGDDDDGQCRGDHPHAQPGNNVGSRTRHRLPDN